MTASIPYLGFLLLPLGLFLCLRSSLSLMIATIMAAPWMSASVLNINFGEYGFGVQPGYYFAVLYLIRMTVFHRPRLRPNVLVSTLQRYVGALGLWGVISALALPFVFAGRVLVVSPRILYVLHSEGEPLMFRNTNISQTMYFVCVLAFFTVAVRQLSSHPQMLKCCAKWYMIAGILATATALYDLLKWEYNLPSIAWLFENPQYGKSLFSATVQGEFLQKSGDFVRVSGCFPEASYFGQFEAAFFPFALYRAITAGRKTDWLAAIVALAGLVLSVSPGAYIVGGILTGVSIALSMKRQFTIRPAVLRFAAIMFAGATLLVVFYEPITSRISLATQQKLETDSFVMRSAWDLIGARVFVGTLGIGAGIGSNRASSLLMTVISNLGIPGALLLLGIGATLLRMWRRAAVATQNGSGAVRGDMDALMLAAAGAVGAGAVAIPDIAVLNMWLALALATGGMAACSAHRFGVDIGIARKIVITGGSRLRQE